MRIEISDNTIRIIPDTHQDIVYLKHVMGLSNEGDTAVLLCTKLFKSDSAFTYYVMSKDTFANWS